MEAGTHCLYVCVCGLLIHVGIAMQAKKWFKKILNGDDLSPKSNISIGSVLFLFFPFFGFAFPVLVYIKFFRSEFFR